MSSLNMARKIREKHQNNNVSKNVDYNQQQIKEKNNEKEYIMAKMQNAYGKKDNYHLNEYNIEYMAGGPLQQKDNQRNFFRLRNIKHNNSKIIKGNNNDLLSINYLKDQFNYNNNNNDKHRGKSSYRPSNITNTTNATNINKNVNNNKTNNNITTNDNTSKIEISETENNNNLNKTENLYYTYDNNNNNNFPTNINNYFMSCKFLFTMNLNEIEDYLKSLWKELGIKDSYINIFNLQKNNFSDIDEITDFLILEIENLKKFEDVLIKLNKEIESREKNINMIKNLCETINKNEGEEIDKKTMNDFFNSIISYRVHSIKVIEYYLLYKEKIIQGNIREKFDEEFLKKKYGLIKDGCNYLIKMKSDMSFISNSKINNHKDINDIFFSFKGDPFLTCLYNVIPVSREYKQRIKYCHYYIIQETVNEDIIKKNQSYNKNKSNNNLYNINTNNTNINNINDLNEYKNYKKKKLEPIVNHSQYKEKITININTTNQNDINKNKEYNTNEYEQGKKYNKSVINKKNINLYDDNKINTDINKVNKMIDIENKKNSNFNYNDNEDIINIQQDDFNNKDEDYSNKINIKKIQINNDKNSKEDYEDINNNININYEKEKQTKNINNKKQENILQNSLTISKKMKSKKENSRSATPETKKLTGVNPSNNLISNNDISNTSIILENNNLKNYNTSYYCGSLSDFISIYTNYYKRIPIEQKKIFNIQENPINYFEHNYFPKIIICSDSKLTLIKGICIYSLIFNNNENKANKIIIEHLSAYNKEEMENILKNIFDFLKTNNILNNSYNNNNYTNEIYIDLYFYLENEKFVIDTNIRDFIKNELKFKWVKLENLSKGVRYQKMKHQFNNNNNLLNNEIDDNNILNQSVLGLKALNEMNEENNKDNIDDSEDNTLENDIISNDNMNENIFCNFYIKNKSVIKYLNKNEVEKNLEANNDNKLILNNIKYINPFNIIYLIKKISEDSIYSEYILNNTYNFFTMNDHLDIEEILNNNDGVSLNDILANNSFISSDIQQLIDYFNNKNNNNNNKGEDDKNKFDINAKLSFMPLFDNCISIKYNNYYFNRIEHDNIKILIEKETKQKFFFITPNNEKSENIILLISAALNEQFKSKYICPQNNSNIGLKFIDIYNNITSYETTQNDDKNNNKKYLYIPCFDINSKIKNFYKKHSKPENEEEFGESGDTYVINNYEEYFNIKFISEEFIGESKYKNKKNKNKVKNPSINFYFDKIEDDIINNKDSIIDDNFIIFILNFDIIDNFAAIPLMSLYVTQENFISEK